MKYPNNLIIFSFKYAKKHIFQVTVLFGFLCYMAMTARATACCASFILSKEKRVYFIADPT